MKTPKEIAEDYARDILEELDDPNFTVSFRGVRIETQREFSKVSTAITDALLKEVKFTEKFTLREIYSDYDDCSYELLIRHRDRQLLHRQKNILNYANSCDPTIVDGIAAGRFMAGWMLSLFKDGTLEISEKEFKDDFLSILKRKVNG